MKNIYLVGMPGCGKTTIGNIVADNLGIPFMDLDRYIVDREGRTIPEIFKEGESVFRKAETDALKAVSNTENLLVATGGGIVTVEENINIMKSTGKIIFIDASADFILNQSSLEGRPLLNDKDRIYELYKSRISLYRRAADYTVSNDTILSDVCKKTQQIVSKINKHGLK